MIAIIYNGYGFNDVEVYKVKVFIGEVCMFKKVLKINGVLKTIITDPEVKLSDVLRKQLLLTGTKVGCGIGECGACNVIMNGKVTRSCITRMKRVPDEAEIITIEGIGNHKNLHPLQLAWMIHGGAQCGFCTPGFIVSAKVLLDENPDPTREEVRAWFQKTRNVCRCTGYVPLVDSVMTGDAIANACDNLMKAMEKEDGSYRTYDEMISEGLPVKYDGKWIAAKVACDLDTGQGDPFPALDEKVKKGLEELNIRV